jgi:transposase
MCEAREQRGLLIAATMKVVQKGLVWLVPSQSGKGKYTVCPDKEHPHCTCPDHETRGCECKHILAVRYVIQRRLFDDGSVVETRQLVVAETRKSYPQNWKAYNRAQNDEKSNFQVLLADLCKGIQPPQSQRIGRPRVQLADAVFATMFKVYSTFSGRRFITDLDEAHQKGYLSRPLSHSSIFKAFESPDLFPVLKSLVERSAAPLKHVEEHFSCDSSGFSGCRYDRWVEHKYGSPMKKILRAWCKVHVMTGAKTNIISAVEIHDQHANDGVQLKPLMATTAQRFTIKELSADMAYSNYGNLEAVDAIGAFPLIRFRKNASPAVGGLWAKMYHYVNLNRDEFLNRYHKRSNIESTFSAIKRRFGDSLRSKTDVAMKNESLAKLLCHNLCVVNHEMHESGVDPTLWTESPIVHNVGVG